MVVTELSFMFHAAVEKILMCFVQHHVTTVAYQAGECGAVDFPTMQLPDARTEFPYFRVWQRIANCGFDVLSAHNERALPLLHDSVHTERVGALHCSC